MAMQLHFAGTTDTAVASFELQQELILQSIWSPDNAIMLDTMAVIAQEWAKGRGVDGVMFSAGYAEWLQMMSEYMQEFCYGLCVLHK